MGQIETKLHSSVPAKYLEFALDTTHLQPEAVQICWALWRRDSRLPAVASSYSLLFVFYVEYL